MTSSGEKNKSMRFKVHHRKRMDLDERNIFFPGSRRKFINKWALGTMLAGAGVAAPSADMSGCCP